MTMQEYYYDCRKFDKLPYRERVETLNRFIEQDRSHWQDIHDNGCSDPFWEDGTNMNLVRNHIIGWCRMLHMLAREDRQMDMFESLESAPLPDDFMQDERIPPKVDNRYMAKARQMACGIKEATV